MVRRSIAVLVALVPTSCAVVAPPPPPKVADGVEPHVRAAYEAAWRRLPAPWRERLADVELHRAAALGVPQDAPLGARLLDRAAYAYFTNVQRRIYVTDAGARLEPRWQQPAPTRAEVGAWLLDEVGAPVGEGEREVRVDAAWAWFAAQVHGWRAAPPPSQVPAVGDVAVLDAFLRDGVTRSLGGDVPLVQLLFHELAHAVHNQLHGMEARLSRWATLSGFREPDGDRAADGYSGGMFAMERTEVLVRLLLDLPRGDATYVPSPAARFVNRYARFDLREDFAECARLMAFAPERLAAVAPEKLLYLNALGWSARLDLREPGPLWLSPAQLREPALRQALAAGARRLLAEGEDGIAPDPLAVAAVLRAHASLLRAADLPPPHLPIAAPTDLPGDLRAHLSAERFTFAVDGVERQPPPAGIRRMWDDEVTRWIEHREFAEGLEVLLGDDADQLRARYRDDVLGAPDAAEREQRFDRMLVAAGGTVPSGEVAQWLRAEAAFHAQAGRALLATRYRLLAGDASVAAAALGDARTYPAVELAVAVARLHLAAGRGDAARAAIDAVPGESWGAYRRVRLWLDVGDRDAARRVADGCALPSLREKLLRDVAERRR